MPFMKILAFAIRWQFLRKKAILSPLIVEVPYFLCMPEKVYKKCQVFLRDKEFSDEIKAWSCYEEKNFKE
jgi:hypothetical protein